MAFTVLTVCTANICRSATAERSLRTAFDGNGLGDLIEVTSAGVAAIPGAPMCPEAAELLDAPTPPGASPHASRRLTAELVTGADLVLTADRGHLGAAGALAPGRRARLYTLRQAATLLEWVIGGSGVLDIARLRAAGGAPDLDPLDPLVQVPALPESLDDRLAWLLDELDAARGTAPVGGPTFRRPLAPAGGAPGGGSREPLPWDADDVGDPHELGFEYHPDSVGLIVAAAQSIGRAFATVLR